MRSSRCRLKKVLLSVTGTAQPGCGPTVKQVSVPIDDLVAIDQEKEVIAEQNPLKQACDSSMPQGYKPTQARQ